MRDQLVLVRRLHESRHSAFYKVVGIKPLDFMPRDGILESVRLGVVFQGFPEALPTTRSVSLLVVLDAVARGDLGWPVVSEAAMERGVYARPLRVVRSSSCSRDFPERWFSNSLTQ